MFLQRYQSSQCGARSIRLIKRRVWSFELTCQSSRKTGSPGRGCWGRRARASSSVVHASAWGSPIACRSVSGGTHWPRAVGPRAASRPTGRWWAASAPADRLVPWRCPSPTLAALWSTCCPLCVFHVGASMNHSYFRFANLAAFQFNSRFGSWLSVTTRLSNEPRRYVTHLSLLIYALIEMVCLGQGR